MRRILPETHRAAWAFLALAVLACYVNAVHGDFQFDDYNVIVYNQGVHSWQSWLQGLGSGIRPLLKLSYVINWTSGLGVAGFHLVNIAIHLCNVGMVFMLTRHFLHANPRLTEHSFGVPFLTALLFAVHPIHTEAVTYICGRSIALMTLFYLAGLLAYAWGRGRQSVILVYVATPLCFLAALGVKESAVTFPLALLAWHLAGGGTLKEALRTQWVNWLVLISGGLFFLLNGSYLTQMERSADFNSLQGNVATQADAFLYLMRQWLIPLWLNIDPDIRAAHSLGDKIPQLLLVAGIATVMVVVFRRRPWIGFALAWALIQLLPLYVFLPRLDVANDRQMYLASWPLAMAIMIELATRMKRKYLLLSGAVLVTVLGGMTVVRNQAYQNEILLWEDTVALSPQKARAHNNLGSAYELAGRKAEARQQYAVALHLNPDYRKAQDNLRRLGE